MLFLGLDQCLALVRGEVNLYLQQGQLQGAEDIHTGVSRVFEDVHYPTTPLHIKIQREVLSRQISSCKFFNDYPMFTMGHFFVVK